MCNSRVLQSLNSSIQMPSLGEHLSLYLVGTIDVGVILSGVMALQPSSTPQTLNELGGWVVLEVLLGANRAVTLILGYRSI
jgi:hypothetical protein